MHNCKLTRNTLIELALDELTPASTTQALAELNDCEECREEFAAVTSTLHISAQAVRSALPAEDFWSGYHQRLRSRLMTSHSENVENGFSSATRPAPIRLSSAVWLALSRMATTSIRVPVPAVLALIVVVGTSFFVLRSRAQVIAVSTPTTIETRTVEVPVIQEKVITRLVYVAKHNRGSQREDGRLHNSSTSELANSVARVGTGSQTKGALSLAGFKPTDQVKLTVIKGTYKDEK
jgi:anti-sigma factor RsiW